jgi:hypothetical protein
LERLRDAARIHPFRASAVGVMALVLLIGIGNVAAQFWTDQRLANRALARVAEMDAELAKIAGEAESVRAEIEDAKSDSGKRSALNKRLHVLDARWILTEFEAVRLLASVAEMRFIWVESEIQPLARKRLIELGESLNARDQPALASGLAKNVLARHAEGDDPFKLSEADVAKLKQFAAEADRRFVAPRD